MTTKPNVDILGKSFRKVLVDETVLSHPYLIAESLLNNLITSQKSIIEEIDHHLDFNDIDAISDCIDRYNENARTLTEEIQYHKENPSDILYGFKKKFKTDPKFRRYADNKRTRERIG